MPDPVEIAQLDIAVSGGTLTAFGLGPDRSIAPPVVAVHGITANSRAWLPVARALGSRAALLAPDLRGRGRSNGLPGPYGLAAHAADVLALLDQLGVQQAILVGHSLGAYIVSRVAAEHPQRVHAAVLVDGGLTVPGSEGVDPQRFLEAFLGPALARLALRFSTREQYRDWWQRHPALAGSDVDEHDLAAYADHDLVGEGPELRSSVLEEAVRADADDLFEIGAEAHRLAVPATLLCAPRGLLDDPSPMQPLWLAQAWAAKDPANRRATPVPGVNHYTITLGAKGAATVAETILAHLPA